MKRVAALGMNNVSRKQVHEFRVLCDSGYHFDIFTTDQCGGSEANVALLAPRANCYLLKEAALPRLWQLSSYLWKYRRELAHAQVYPGGRYGFVYIILSKLLRLKTLSVEWGTLVDWDVLHPLIRFSLWLCHRYADIVWYKEPYMEAWMKRFGARSLYFIHNAVPPPPATNTSFNKKYDFLWVNRLVRHRRSDWLVDVLVKDEFAHTSNALLGIQKDIGDRYIREMQDYVTAKKLPNLELHDFIEPWQFYLDSRFFVLPATIVFCNNALIEAMSCGVVPIASRAEGTELIIEDGVDGFIAEHSKEGLESAMKRAMRLTAAEYEAMSANAVRKVASRFNVELWRDRIIGMYNTLHAM